MLSMIIEVTECAYTERQKHKLKEVAAKMNEQLRAEILEDKGNSTLKRVCLDFITRLRIECNMLNEAKNGPAVAKKHNLTVEIPEDATEEERADLIYEATKNKCSRGGTRRELMGSSFRSNVTGMTTTPPVIDKMSKLKPTSSIRLPNRQGTMSTFAPVVE
jgi:hypothetical protein